jgi:ion channel-forming bestrophin family protein
MIRSNIFAVVVTLTAICQTGEAFAPARLPSSSLAQQSRNVPSVRQTTSINGNTKFAPSLPPIKDISYGEESRKYRRTVYSHDDWRKHRNPDRFLYYIVSFLSSGVYKNVGREVAFTTVIAAVVCLWNGLIGGFTDFDGVKHAAILSSNLLPLLSLPLAPFTLSSPSLGLLLGKNRL